MSVGIIAEYNPFHNGHVLQIEEAKRRWPNEDIIIIMSGKYVQRGELAVASFKKRSKIAKKYGANKVIELPFEYATQAAHIFAHGAVKTAVNHGIDKLFFGSESNNPTRLMLIAKTIRDNEDKYNKTLKSYLKQGYSFPKSAGKALESLIGNPITLPNDILGLEYCKAIIYNDYSIVPHTLKRTVSFHSVVPSGEFASATYIRNLINKGCDVSKYTPMKFLKTPQKIEEKYVKFQEIVNKYSAEDLSKIKLISEGMENLFKKHIHFETFDEFVDACNSRRYTSSRIKRVMLYVLLEIKK
ncbi:MAG: nucleotidyltransferase [Mycoplasmataceae bacterium]|nr:nucleotidyltransferase [Mycoplasmataceae bacterium]